MGDQLTIECSLHDLLAFIRIQVKRGGYSVRDGVATCPAELMLNLDLILDAAERGAIAQPVAATA